MWTQRNPLRDAASTRLEEKFYGARNDGLIDGLNVEVSNGLTFIRRPGLSVFNSQTFPRIDGFYQFRLFNSVSETIKVMADTASVLYDATGPSTKFAVWNKPTGAGQTLMQSVGNILYFGNGVEQKKWVQSALKWQATTAFATGNYVVDSNNNLQVSYGGITVAISSVSLTSNVVTITLDPTDPNLPTNLMSLVGLNLTVSGCTNATFLNGQTITIASVPQGSPATSSNGFTAAFVHADYPETSDTGQVTSGTGTSDLTQPVWSTTRLGWTLDGGVQWQNHGSAVENWGIVAPNRAPVVSYATKPNPFGSWQANTYYGYNGLYIGTVNIIIPFPSNNFELFQCTTAGTINGTVPTFNPTVGATTSWNTAVFTTLQTVRWNFGTAYTSGVYTYISPGGTGYVYVCTQGGVSAGTQMGWATTPGAIVVDGSAVWTCLGRLIDPSDIAGAFGVASSGSILDEAGYVQTAQMFGLSGGTEPTWGDAVGDTTADGTLSWTCTQAYSAAGTGNAFYAYSFKNSVTNTVSTASPSSFPKTLPLNGEAVIQGYGSDDPQVDTIQIFRTTQGGALLLLLDEIPAPANSSSLWSYTDNLPDTSLNIEIPAPVSHVNDPPATGFTPSAYHLGRIWGMVDNTVYFSNGPDTLDGNGNEAFPPANSFVFPSKTTRLWPSSQGLFVFTVSDVYLISGLGTSASPFYSLPFLTGLGLLNYNAFDINGTTLYLLTSDRQMVSLDLSSGVSEVGFPIGDQFEQSNWSPATANVTWHIAGSADKGVYVSDNATGWFRMYPTPAPESGLTWAPFAELQGGCSMVQSVETTPGTHDLLVGPSTSGPILKRDRSVQTDNGTAYPANFTIGSIVLAQPGQLAEIAFITTDSIKIGTAPDLYVQLDEISPFSSGHFDLLSHTDAVNDPPQLSASDSMFSQRYWLSNTHKPALGRSLQIRVDWGIDSVQNELLSLTLYGGFSQEAIGA